MAPPGIAPLLGGRRQRRSVRREPSDRQGQPPRCWRDGAERENRKGNEEDVADEDFASEPIRSGGRRAAADDVVKIAPSGIEAMASGAETSR